MRNSYSQSLPRSLERSIRAVEVFSTRESILQQSAMVIVHGPGDPAKFLKKTVLAAAPLMSEYIWDTYIHDRSRGMWLISRHLDRGFNGP